MPRPPLELERQLNPDQIAAVTHGEGPQLVLAGAGSGKTRVITYRISWLVEERGVDPSRIAAVTFTNKAAAEMRERVEQLLGIYPLPTFVGTFHRYALVLLRRYGERVGLRRDFVILDTSDQLSLMKQALAAENLSEKAFPPRSVLSEISSAKNRLLDPAAYEQQAENFFQRKVSGLYRRYQGLLQQASGVDFDDMISLSVKLLVREAEVRERMRFRTQYLLVDEYQDTNHAQLRLIEELAGKDGNLTAVGDEDQGIYRWRGADLDNILKFEDDLPRRRGPQARAATTARPRPSSTPRGRWSPTTSTAAASGCGPSPARRRADRAVTRAATRSRRRAGSSTPSRVCAATSSSPTSPCWCAPTPRPARSKTSCCSQEVAYSLVGGVRFYERAEIKDLIAYLRVLRNPRDNFSLMRIVNQPPRGIGKSTLDMLQAQAVELGQPVWDVLYLGETGGLPARSATALRNFRDLIVGLQHDAADLPLPALLDRLLATTGYAELYRKDDPDDQARLENIREFLSAAQEFTEANSSTAAGPATPTCSPASSTTSP